MLPATSRASQLLKAMSNERRLIVLSYLSEREHSVNELCELVGISQSALSQHLAKLRRYHLVATRRDAQTVYYSIATPEVGQILSTLTELYTPKDEDAAQENYSPPARAAANGHAA